MIIAVLASLLLLACIGVLVCAILLSEQSERLREECQMMRTARSVSSQCPLVGHVKINASNVI